MNEDDEKIFEALTAGASGYILKKTAPHKLLEAIRELQEGGAPMSSQIARKVVSAFQHNKPMDKSIADTSSLWVLSNREKEILELLAKGMLYKEIAASLFISQETVRKHVYHIYEKLHVNNRVEDTLPALVWDSRHSTPFPSFFTPATSRRHELTRSCSRLLELENMPGKIFDFSEIELTLQKAVSPHEVSIYPFADADFCRCVLLSIPGR